MRYRVKVAGSPSGCPNGVDVADSTHEIVSDTRPRLGAWAEYYNLPRVECSCWVSAHDCHDVSCHLGQIIKIIVLDLPEGWSHDNEVLVDEACCPKCGRHDVACNYWENGPGLYFVDHFMHKCTNPDCGHILEGPTTEDGGMASYEYDWPSCPFCGRKSVGVTRPKVGPCTILNFDWILSDRLATGGKLTDNEQLRWLLTRGFKAIVSLEAMPDSIVAAIKEAGLDHLYLDIGDEEEFDVAQISPEAWEKFVDFMLRSLKKGLVFVHCSAGIRRSSQMINRFLILHPACGI